ncbi:MAG TPA: NADH-quinone oxidoreductase subunit J [Polyangiales bacterium]
MLDQVAFAVVALIMLAAAVKVVSSQNLVHTVLWLGVMLAGTSVVFVMLQAPFLAAIQLILYTGGLLTLMLFGIMLTQRDAASLTIPNPSHRRGFGALLGAAAFGMLAGAISKTPSLPNEHGAMPGTQELGRLFFTQNALAFEVLAVLLLAATLGAIVFARKADAGVPSESAGAEIPARRTLPRTNGQHANPGKGA